jgi:2-oxoglutarate dehydrogenase E1 component
MSFTGAGLAYNPSVTQNNKNSILLTICCIAHTPTQRSNPVNFGCWVMSFSRLRSFVRSPVLLSQQTQRINIHSYLHNTSTSTPRHLYPSRYLSSFSSSSESHKLEVKLKLLRLIRNFRISGHFVADLDPLKLSSHLVSSDLTYQSDICLFLRHQDPNYQIFDLQNVPLDELYHLGDELKVMGKEYWTLRELVTSFKQIYCGHVSVEYSHIENNLRRQWIQEHVEGKYGLSGWNLVTHEEKKLYWQHLMKADHTSQFLGKRFSTAKIFGIDGCESLLPALWTIAHTASDLGAEFLEVGMTHRGRMNVLHNFFEKSFRSICNKFNEGELYSGDVKFHLGARASLKVGKEQAREMHVSLCANPSHLEAVYPVVIGKTKAKQFYVGDKEMKRVLPLILHGYMTTLLLCLTTPPHRDAAFSGQGIVPETMQVLNFQ